MPKRPFDPGDVLWTVMYLAPSGAGLKPYAPGYTGIPYERAQQALFQLRGKYPKERFRLAPAEDPHLTVAQGRKALAEVLKRSTRPELARVARRVRRADIPIMASLALEAERQQRALDEWARENERRQAKGLPLIPKPDFSTVPQVEIRGGRVVIHMGGAR